MTQQEVFSSAKWLTSDKSGDNGFFILRSRFSVEKAEKATLRVLGLGIFHCYINGVRMGNDLFLPLSTDFEERKNYPNGETVSGHRIYVPEYDITPLLTDGENVIAIHFGGWYTFGENSKYGDAKAIWRIFGEDLNGELNYVSSEKDKIAESFVKDYHFTCTETQDWLNATTNALSAVFDDSGWQNAICAKPLDTDYLFSDCPPDRVSSSVEFDICIPENQPAEFIFGEKSYKLNAGKNTFKFAL